MLPYLAGISVTPLFNAFSSISATGNKPHYAWGEGVPVVLLYVSVFSFLDNMLVIFLTTLLSIFIDHTFSQQYIVDFIDSFQLIVVVVPVRGVNPRHAPRVPMQLYVRRRAHWPERAAFCKPLRSQAYRPAPRSPALCVQARQG